MSFHRRDAETQRMSKRNSNHGSEASAESRRGMKAAVASCNLPLRLCASAVILCALTACTVAPKPVTDKVASYDGNAQNSGFISWASDGGGIITPHARDRYNALIELYGTRFLPPLKYDAGITATPTNTFHIDAEHLVQFGIMNAWRKSSLTNH